MDAAGRFRRDMARDAAREAELLEQPLHALGIPADVRIDLAIGALQIGVGDQRRPAMPRPDHIDHVEVVALDHPIEVDVDQVQPRGGAPMTEQPRLDVGTFERLSQQRIVEQIDLPDGQVIRRPPVGVHGRQFGLIERRFGRPLRSVLSLVGRALNCHDGLLSISIYAVFSAASGGECGPTADQPTLRILSILVGPVHPRGQPR